MWVELGTGRVHGGDYGSLRVRRVLCSVEMVGLAWEVMVVVGGEELVVCECEFGASRSCRCADGSDKLNASHVRSVYPGRGIGGVPTVRHTIILTF